MSQWDERDGRNERDEIENDGKNEKKAMFEKDGDEMLMKDLMRMMMMMMMMMMKDLMMMMMKDDLMTLVALMLVALMLVARLMTMMAPVMKATYLLHFPHVGDDGDGSETIPNSETCQLDVQYLR